MLFARDCATAEERPLKRILECFGPRAGLAQSPCILPCQLTEQQLNRRRREHAPHVACARRPPRRLMCGFANTEASFAFVLHQFKYQRSAATVMLSTARPVFLRPWYAASCSSRALQPARRLKTTLTKVAASSSAERQAPTPLLFLSASKLGKAPPAAEHWKAWTDYFSKNGWESLLLDLDLTEEARAKATNSTQVLEALEREMVTALRSAPGGLPFPPALLSRGWLAGLAAQQYAASNSLSALVLVDPAISSSRAFESHPDVLRSEPEEPNFEARFPCKSAGAQRKCRGRRTPQCPGMRCIE